MDKKHFSETETRFDDVAQFVRETQGFIISIASIVCGFTAIIFGRVTIENANLFYVLIGHALGSGSSLMQSPTNKHEEENNLMMVRQPRRDEQDMP